MSGQPNRYAADAAKFRQDYMNALDLRTSLDDQVLQAVKVYKQTGQVPAISSMPDNRTNEEKLADKEGLKMKILAELKPLGDSQFCQALLQRIMRSVYNTDGSFFAFIAQRVSGIVKNLTADYGMGSGSSSGFIERVAGIMEDLYAKDRAMSTTTKSYFDRPSNTSTGTIGAGDLTQLKQQYDTLLPKIIARVGIGVGGNAPLAREIQQLLDSLSTLLNSDRYKLISQRVIDLTNPQANVVQAHMDMLYDAYNNYNDMIQLLPSFAKLNALFLQLEKSLVNARPELTTKILTTIYEQFPSPETIQNVNQSIERYIRGMAVIPLPPPMGGFAPPNPQLEATERRIVGPRMPQPIIPRNAGGPVYIVAPPLGAGQAALEAWARNEAAAEPVVNGRTASQILYSVPGVSRDMGGMAAYAALRMAGEGIHQEKRRRGRPKGCGIKVPFSEKVDSSQGVQASPRYISFGKHVINKKKLGDGILSIRTKSGANIATTPVKHISQNMKIVVDKIIGGAIPSYEELSRLTEEEKAYLHKVSKQADILDKFSIPAPSKDQEEKEIHEYEVMRGEIMSGNDNKDLIKKFKLLIIKLSRRNALPKKEVSDILSELVELGY